MTTDTLNLGEVRRLLLEALQVTERMDGQDLPSDAATPRDRARQTSALAKDLLYLGHVCRKAEVLTHDAYQSSRGFTGHLPEQGAR